MYNDCFLINLPLLKPFFISLLQWKAAKEELRDEEEEEPEDALEYLERKRRKEIDVTLFISLENIYAMTNASEVFWI